jgi:hypothetical protein
MIKLNDYMIILNPLKLDNTVLFMLIVTNGASAEGSANGFV